MELNNTNYFSKEANNEYMSVSQFKDFIKCPDCAMAKINGYFQPKPTEALRIGSYVDAMYEGTEDDFIEANPDMFNTRTGELKAPYRKANMIYARTQADMIFSQYMSGAKQLVLEGELFGYKWKCKIDSFHTDKIVDLKVMKDFQPVYVEGEGRKHFIDAWGYDIQGAVYQEIAFQNFGTRLPFYIAAVTKEEVPDIAIFEIPQYKLDAALKIVEYNIDDIMAVKEGLTKAPRCERCDWCKLTKKLEGPIVYEEDNIE